MGVVRVRGGLIPGMGVGQQCERQRDTSQHIQLPFYLRLTTVDNIAKTKSCDCNSKGRACKRPNRDGEKWSGHEKVRVDK